MNILYITPFYVPAYGFGGPVVVAHSIAKMMVKKGHQATVLTTDALDSSSRITEREETIDGVKIRRFPNISPKLAKNFNFYTPRGLAGYLRKNIKSYQLVHLHSFFTYLNVRAASECHKWQIPYVLQLHESPLPLPVLGKVAIKKLFNWLWGKKILRNAAKIIVVSGRERDLLTGYLPELKSKIEILSNQPAQGLPEAKANRADFGLKQSDKVLLSLSRLGRIKRIDAAIRALGQLVKNDPSYRLLIAGEDEAGTKQELEAIVATLGLAKQVKFLGHVDATRRAELFSITDLYLLFSRYESFSISTLEALHYGVPVCLSKEVGVGPDIIPLGCGVVVEDADNAVATASVIDHAYQRRATLASHCAEALKLFESEKLQRQVSAIYDNLTVTNQ